MRAYLLATPTVEEIWSCLWQKDIKIESLCDGWDFSILRDLWNSDETSIVTMTFLLKTAILKDNSDLLHLGSGVWKFILDLWNSRQNNENTILTQGPPTGFFWAIHWISPSSSEPSSWQLNKCRWRPLQMVESSSVRSSDRFVRVRVKHPSQFIQWVCSTLT